MLGAIIGDVVGSAYEFNTTKNYNFQLFTRESDYTDDTIMSMAVADWAMHDPKLSHQKLESVMVAMAEKFPCPMGGYGNRFQSWLFHTEVRKPYNSWGNGSAMRVSSIGWLFDTLEETEHAAELSASITHNHPEGIKGAQATAAVTFMARNGKSKEEIKEYVEKRFGYDLSMPWEKLHGLYTWDDSCQGTVPAAIISFLDSTDFESAIRMTVALGGDSDTLGAITGSMAEAYYRKIPEKMVSAVLSMLPEMFLKLLQELGEGAYRVCYEQYKLSVAENREYTPERIVRLQPGEVFVFGSNLAGKHGGGAARLAYEKFGAEWGVGVGMTGQCYAIPTMQGGVETIVPYVDEFIAYAQKHPEYKFFVTKIGCGIAGFSEHEIAPLFKEALHLENVILPKSFHEIIMR